jgi:SsrA-binding protein
MQILKTNKKAYFDYEILEELEAGIVLDGAEVKSTKQGNVKMIGTFLKFYNEELFLLNMYIGNYNPSGKQKFDNDRNRKLLLSKKQLIHLFAKSQIKGNTLIPLEIYINDKNLIKVKIAVAKGKKKYEKKQIIKERQEIREIGRKLKNYGK